jgi:hypothetical protein
VAHLFALLFFAAVLGTAIAMIWSVVDANRTLIAAHLPWKAKADWPETIVRSVSRNGSAYWATPSMTSDTPSRARMVSPAMTR